MLTYNKAKFTANQLANFLCMARMYESGSVLLMFLYIKVTQSVNQ